MKGIFISYRRSDTPADAGRLYTELVHRFGPESIFFDVDHVPLGGSVREAIEEALSRSAVLIVLIGPDWDPPRLHDSQDWVRLELEQARQYNVTVLPVRVRQALIPGPSDLPESLSWLPGINAASLEHDSWGRDLPPVLNAIRLHLTRQAEAERQAEAPAELPAGSKRSGTEKRARQRANRQLKLEQQERHERTARRRQYGLITALIAITMAAGLAITLNTNDDDPERNGAAVEDETSDNGSGSTAADPASDDASESTDQADCPAEDGSSEQRLSFPGPPPVCIDRDATYLATLDTNLGTIVAELDSEQAPDAVNNFVFLARYHYYDGTTFHRIISDFIIQGGDPNGDPPGTGGPGYVIDEEPPETGGYPIGSLAMAKRREAGSTDGQFFIVTGSLAEGLPPQESLFGHVIEGMDVVGAIDALPTDDVDHPTEEIVVRNITITESQQSS